MGAETDLSPPPPEPTASLEPEILTRDDRSWKADMMSALGESVSFGRFLAEPLEWGKWSAFEHKRYIEEAAGQSRPGSVAQKKAFFEDHYAKKRKSLADAGGDEEDVEDAGHDTDRDDPADGSAMAWSADSSCMTDGEETHGVDSDAPDCGGGIADAGPVEAAEELKAVTDGVGSSCSLVDTDDQPHEKDDVQQVAEAREGLQLHIDVGTVAAVDSVEKQPLQESSIVNQGITDSVKKRRLPMSSFFQKPTECSSPPSSGKKTSSSSMRKRSMQCSSPPSSGKKTSSSSMRKRSMLRSAKENSSPPPSTDSSKQAATSVPQKRSALDTMHMSMNFRRCETGNATSRSRNLGSTIASRISQLESASRPVKDIHPKVSQLRPTRKGFCRGMPEIVSRTSQLDEQRSSDVSVMGVKEKLFGSTSPPVHRKTNITAEKMGKANNEPELKELRQGICFKAPNFCRKNKEPKDSSQQSAQEITHLPNSDHLLNDASNPHRMSKGSAKDKHTCCFPLRRLC